MRTELVEVPVEGRTLRLEYQWLDAGRSGAPLLVFLHEGLGSVAMWKDYPRRLCEAGGFRGLVYSRPGYGRSTPRAAGERWPVDSMHRQAREVLPAFLRAVGAGDEKPWLFGHSDGASIALLYAAARPDALSGAILLAPHIFVEDVTVRGIEHLRTVYETTDLRQKLARYHDDPDSAFWGWNDAWLAPAFRQWNLEALLPAIRCPLLAVQGYQDEYATMEQLHGIQRQVPHAELLKLDSCRHSPHVDQPEAVTAATLDFIRRAGAHPAPGG